MADDVLESHKTYITELYRSGLPEETIADHLDVRGVKTTHNDIYESLSRWDLIPAPSPVYSGDTVDSSDDRQQNPEDMLSITCHHGEESHASQSSLSRIPSHPTSIQRYERDVQSHEKLAYGLQLQDNDTEDYPCPREFRRKIARYKKLAKRDSRLTFSGLLGSVSTPEVADGDSLDDVRVPQKRRLSRPHRMRRVHKYQRQEEAHSCSSKEPSNRHSDKVG